MTDILRMTEEDLIVLDPESVDRLLEPKEVIHMAEVLGALWRYDYEAAKNGRLGMHAELKSGRHSDAFFASKILLQYLNIRELFATQLVKRFEMLGIPNPIWAGGIPDGATGLGVDLSEIMGVKNAEMKKEDGKIILTSEVLPGETLLLVEDFCTRGTGFIEAVKDILEKQPQAVILPFEMVILNRGGLKFIKVEGVDSFRIVASVEYRVTDWAPKKCPLCKKGSTVIKPKETDENWHAITTSQLA